MFKDAGAIRSMMLSVPGLPPSARAIIIYPLQLVIVLGAEKLRLILVVEALVAVKEAGLAVRSAAVVRKVPSVALYEVPLRLVAKGR
jgi:hypothetical protein